MTQISPRHFYIFEQQYQAQILPHFLSHKAISAVWIGDKFSYSALPFVAFQQSKNLLGQEFDLIIYDCQQALHLESLAIASGTLKAGGLMIMLVTDWATWQQQTDADSLRWHSATDPVSAVNFRHYFKQLYQRIFPQLSPLEPSHLPIMANFAPSQPHIHNITATSEQQRIIESIRLKQAKYYILTAPRGRGKSTLAGLLANQLNEKIYVTSANKNAINKLQKCCLLPLYFIAPDELYAQLQQATNDFSDCWLFVDEAAMLPIHFLHQYCQHFKHILLTTTTHSYEGTGRGFQLKFMPSLTHNVQRFTLTQPLRWAKQDPLEQFIDELLLLNDPNLLPPPNKIAKQSLHISSISQQTLTQNLALLKQFYRLLSLAHYRTSPIDLRRLFDSDKQQFWLAQQHNNLIGGIWGIEEGGIADMDLIEHIQQGLRRPKGNLVAQLLCFQQQQKQACTLKALRISRIAIAPDYQQQGIGSALIKQLIQYYQSCSSTLDYLSVSFGYQPRLAQFWQQAGFQLVYLGEHRETSTGYYNAVAIYPLTKQGELFCQQARQYFVRNIGLQSHQLSLFFGQFPLDWQLTSEDLISLKNFAYFHRTFYATFPAIQRLILHSKQDSLALLIQHKHQYSHKQWLALMRKEVAKGIALL